MAIQATGPFTSWSLSDQEIISGSVLSFTQKQVIQNQRAQVAEQILGLVFDPLNPVQFAQDDAHLKGQLAAFNYLLLLSDESETALKAMQSAQNS